MRKTFFWKIPRALGSKIKYQFTLILFFCFLLPILFGFDFFIEKTLSDTRENSMRLAEKTTQQISSSVSMIQMNLSVVSEHYANDEKLLEMLDWDYSGNPVRKRANMVQMKNRFLETDPLNLWNYIGAIYTNEKELFNFYTREKESTLFYDPVPSEKIEMLENLNITDKDHLAKMIWYPMQENIFLSEKSGDIRQDHILLGSRNTYHRYLGRYLNTHIFVVPEQCIFDLYSPYIRENQTVHILDGEFQLISSSDTDYLENKPLPEGLIEALQKGEASSFSLRMEGKEQFVSYVQNENTGWYTVLEISAHYESQFVLRLFRNLMIVTILCVVLLSIIMLLFSNRISKPLEKMVNSMKQVSMGTFTPVPESDCQNEIGEITRFYNEMVKNLEYLIENNYEKDKKSRRLEAKVLVGQINPHFVYNTLETIVWKANQANLPELSAIASQLGKLLRLSVREEGVFIPLSQELMQTKIYMDIQNIRYKEKLSFEILPFPKELEACKVVHMILQPCIENAITHGMRGQEKTLKITVEIKAEDDMLHFIISDNGKGMEKERLAEVNEHIVGKNGAKFMTEGSGIGIKNIQERIALYFGERYGVSIQSELGKGTRVSILMPLVSGENTLD